LQEKFIATKLYRPMRIGRYEPGTELFYDITEVEKPNKAQIHLYIDKFVGGGFAGQVYRVKVLDIKSKDSLVFFVMCCIGLVFREHFRFK
jgi:hypothetical protein